MAPSSPLSTTTALCVRLVVVIILVIVIVIVIVDTDDVPSLDKLSVHKAYLGGGATDQYAIHTTATIYSGPHELYLLIDPPFRRWAIRY